MSLPFNRELRKRARSGRGGGGRNSILRDIILRDFTYFTPYVSTNRNNYYCNGVIIRAREKLFRSETAVCRRGTTTTTRIYTLYSIIVTPRAGTRGD